MLNNIQNFIVQNVYLAIYTWSVDPVGNTKL